MSSHNHMPPVPPANRTKDAGASHAEVNTAEQGDTANIRQNTTNKGFLPRKARQVDERKRREPARRSQGETPPPNLNAANRCRAELAIIPTT
jgi:hypothetical protein